MLSASDMLDLAALLEEKKKCTLTLQVGKEASTAIQADRKGADFKEQDACDDMALKALKRMLAIVFYNLTLLAFLSLLRCPLLQLR